MKDLGTAVHPLATPKEVPMGATKRGAILQEKYHCEGG